MTREVRVQPRAAADIVRVTRRIAATVSPASANRWRTRVERAVHSLALDADQWPEADEAAKLGINLRCRLDGKRPHVYRILFEIDGPTVFVQRVRHAAQDAITEDDL